MFQNSFETGNTRSTASEFEQSGAMILSMFQAPIWKRTPYLILYSLSIQSRKALADSLFLLSSIAILVYLSE
jgi:hypothetical protein